MTTTCVSGKGAGSVGFDWDLHKEALLSIRIHARDLAHFRVQRYVNFTRYEQGALHSANHTLSFNSRPKVPWITYLAHASHLISSHLRQDEVCFLSSSFPQLSTWHSLSYTFSSRGEVGAEIYSRRVGKDDDDAPTG